MKTFAKLSAALLCTLLAGVAAALAFYFAATAGATLQTDKLVSAQEGCVIYDIYDEPVAEVSAEGRPRSVRESELPAHVQDAFICAEDKNFYSHRGLDYKGIARALIANLKARAFKQGASTISQQLIKNTQLTNEKTVRRKLKEIRLTRKLEKRYTKAQILEMYLNTIYFGHGCYGIESASGFYFRKHAAELDVADAATLAAIIRSPNNYSPFVDKKSCLHARDHVLRRMREQGKISESEYDRALAEPLPEQGKEETFCADYIAAAYREMEELPFWHPYKILEGCKVYTYLRPELQNYAEQLKTDADRSGKSILIAENSSRGIAAWHTTEGELRRSPGSALKPFLYAAAIQENLLAPCTPILDEQTAFGEYCPTGYRETYKGWVSAREALADSLNIPAVKVLNSLGTKRGAQYLQKFGLRVMEEDRTLALALGGMAEGYTPRELAGAYTALVRGGTYAPLTYIRRIEDADGKTLYEHSPATIRAVDEDSAALTINMLQSASKTGTAKKLSVLPFDIAAKTGTNGTREGNIDAWALSCTSEHTVAVWMGNADNAPTDITGGGLPCHYCMLLNKKIYGSSSPAPFEIPPSVKKCDIDLTCYNGEHLVRLATQEQPDQYRYTELFRETSLPTEYSPVYASPRDEAVLEANKSGIRIELCYTEYYKYIIKREYNGRIYQIYDGSVDGTYLDTSPPADRFRYRITPYFVGRSGHPVFGCEVATPYVDRSSIKADIPDNWWTK